MKYNKVYSFILSPPDNIQSEIKQFKAFSQTIIGNFDSLHSKAHLSICQPYLQSLKIMGNISKRLEHDLKRIPCIELRIDGFDKFDNGKAGNTIYSKINMSEDVMLWFKVLRKFLNIKDAFIPHITIARGLTNHQFDKIWPHFENLSYNRKFIIDHAKILENEIVKTRKDMIFKNLSFGSDTLKDNDDWTLF